MDRARKTRDEIIKELLINYRVPPEILIEADKGLVVYKNRQFFWQRSAQVSGSSVHLHPWFTQQYLHPGISPNNSGTSPKSLHFSLKGNYEDDNSPEIVTKRKDFVVSCLIKMLAWSLMIPVLAFICDTFSKTPSFFVAYLYR